VTIRCAFRAVTGDDTLSSLAAPSPERPGPSKRAGVEPTFAEGITE
jgi:hypothetical protein